MRGKTEVITLRFESGSAVKTIAVNVLGLLYFRFVQENEGVKICIEIQRLMPEKQSFRPGRICSCVKVLRAFCWFRIKLQPLTIIKISTSCILILIIFYDAFSYSNILKVVVRCSGRGLSNWVYAGSNLRGTVSIPNVIPGLISEMCFKHENP